MTVKINGFCHRRFWPLRQAFKANFKDGLELGASLALSYRGKMVVDLWGGHADPERTKPWQKDTIVVVNSTTKIMAAIAALMLVDRGLLDLDERIAHYWPQFAQGGKENVTVRDALSHQAGVPGFIPPVPATDLLNWLGVTARIAAEPHWFGGERVLCYHASTYGFVLGELVRRVDGRKPAQFVREEIAQKLGTDFQIGLSHKSDLARMATMRDNTGGTGARYPEGSLAHQVWISAGANDLDWDGFVTDWDRLSADFPSVNGFGNGRSLAQICAMVANDKLGGVRYLSRDIVRQAGTQQAYAEDPMMGWLRFGLGFAIDSKAFPAPSPTSMHWGGYGGSWAIADPRARVGFGYAPNNFIVEAPMDDHYQADRRMNRISAALEKLLPTL
jgi:CubicO group peptidase (beta-lactamase class C family)